MNEQLRDKIAEIIENEASTNYDRNVINALELADMIIAFIEGWNNDQQTKPVD